jgi:ParB family chromosome partitioning protein
MDGMEVRMLPVASIDSLLARDRTGLDAPELDELKWSILRAGVRLPIEVYPLEAPDGELAWGLISGYRRLTAVRALHELTGKARWTEIPAFVRPRVGEAAALAAMVAENALRAPLSAWARGRVVVAARDAGAFGTVEAAVEGLHASAGYAKQARLRSLARLAEALEGALPDPEGLSERQALRLAQAVEGGHAGVLRAAFAGVAAGAQGRVLGEVLADIAAAEAPVEAGPRGVARRVPGRRRARVVRLARLVGRRERLAEGWALTVTGADATEAFAAAVMAWLRAQFAPA